MIKELPSLTKSRFCNGDCVDSLKKVIMPTKLGGRRVNIHTNVICKDISLLLSRNAIKMAQAVLDFKNDSLSSFVKKHPLLFTNFSHYCLPLSKNKLEVEKRHSEHISNQLVLICSSPLKMKKKVIKLYREFFHSGAEKLKDLINLSKTVKTVRNL